MSANEFFIPNATKKRNDIQVLEAGPNPGILYSIIDCGTHYNKYFDKTGRVLRLIFEFPLLKQLFNEGDTVARPTVVSQEYSFTLGETSNLKTKIIDGAEGRIVPKNEYKNGWNLGQYLDRTFIIDVVNKPNKSDPTIIYNNIGGIKGLTDKLRATYNFDWSEIVRTNDLVSFFIDEQGDCFKTEQFTKLPPYLNKKVLESTEAIRYKNNGGVFATRDQFKGQEKSEPQIAPPVQRAPVASTAPVKKMLVTDFTYEQYIASGWTDDQLIANGKMEIVTPSAPESAPKPQSAPSGPSSPASALDKVGEDDLPF